LGVGLGGEARTRQSKARHRIGVAEAVGLSDKARPELAGRNLTTVPWHNLPKQPRLPAGGRG